MKQRMLLVNMLLVLAAGGCEGRGQTSPAKTVPLNASNDKADVQRANGDATPEKRIATH